MNFTGFMKHYRLTICCWRVCSTRDTHRLKTGSAYGRNPLWRAVATLDKHCKTLQTVSYQFTFWIFTVYLQVFPKLPLNSKTIGNSGLKESHTVVYNFSYPTTTGPKSKSEYKMVGLWEKRELILLGYRLIFKLVMKNKLYNTILNRPILIHIVKKIKQKRQSNCTNAKNSSSLKNAKLFVFEFKKYENLLFMFCTLYNK